MERTLTNEFELTPAEADMIDVEFAVNGDTVAFERLYRRHVPRIHSVARWLMGREDVDDALQEVFIRAWEKLSSFRGDAAFSTWLHRLATNVILRERERYRRDENRHSGLLVEVENARSAPVTPDLTTDIETAVDRLPERARQVFVLHDMEGYRHEEIGKVLGVSVGTSRSQLHHARMALRSFFEA